MNGLSPSERLTTKEDFQRLRHSTQKVSGKILIYVCVDHDQSYARFGSIVTKKTGNAVVRNRWKRVLREFFRNHKTLFSPTQDHLWIVKSSFEGPPPKEIDQEMKKLLSKQHEKYSL